MTMRSTVNHSSVEIASQQSSIAPAGSAAPGTTPTRPGRSVKLCQRRPLMREGRHLMVNAAMTGDRIESPQRQQLRPGENYGANRGVALICRVARRPRKGLGAREPGIGVLRKERRQE